MEASSDRVNTPADNFHSVQGHTVSDDGSVQIVETNDPKDALGHERGTREYRRMTDDELIKCEYLFCGSVSKIEFGPGATDDEIRAKVGDSHIVSMAKARERDRRKSPEQRAKELDALDEAMEEGQRIADESKAKKLQKRAEAENESARLRREPDLVKRTRAMYQANLIDLPDYREKYTQQGRIVEYLNRDRNRRNIVKAILSEEEAIHFDWFRGRIVDHEGNTIDDNYDTSLWLEVFAAAGLKGDKSVSFLEARKTLREIGLGCKRNDLVRRLDKFITEWDGVERCESYLIDFFETADTPCNREFGKYFWRSLYCRTMIPGSLAPMVLCLFGGQGLGKSRFGNEIAKIITGDPEAIAVQWDLDGDHNDFLRNITGHSVIASIGEMGGMDRSDWNRVKQRIPVDSDSMHQKFEPQYVQKRQWIAILDGNRWDGINRDETGNRRFKSMFCGQLPDVDGKPAWRDDFVISEERWSAFRSDLWQLLAEAAHWVKENGTEEYNAFVRKVSKLVFEENAKDRAAMRGTVRNPDVETFGRDSLHSCVKKIIGNKARGETQRVWIKWTDFLKAFKRESGQRNPNQDHLRLFLASMGGVAVSNAGYAGYAFEAYETIMAMNGAFDPNDGIEASSPEPFDEGN